jgi:hypothetical protein
VVEVGTSFDAVAPARTCQPRAAKLALVPRLADVSTHLRVIIRRKRKRVIALQPSMVGEPACGRAAEPERHGGCGCRVNLGLDAQGPELGAECVLSLDCDGGNNNGEHSIVCCRLVMKRPHWVV